jgi:hypothetical protein
MKSSLTKKDISKLVPYHHGIEHFNSDLTVDWAIDLIESGIETDNVLMLASFSKPVDSVEIRPYVSAVLADLDLEEKEGGEAIFALIEHYLSRIIIGDSIRGYLTLLYDLFLEKDGFNNNDNFGLMPFYLLYHGWSELEDVGVNYYFEGANLDNIEDVTKGQAQIWIDKFIHGVEIEEAHPTTLYKSNGGDSADLKDNTINKQRSWWKRLWS